DKKFEMRTLRPDRLFFQFLHQSPSFGRKWISQFLPAKEFSRFWPTVIARHWRNFFLRPDFVENGDKDLKRQLEANANEANTAPPLTLRAEHYYLAWLTIGELDQERGQQALALRKRLLSLTGKPKSIRIALVGEMPFLRKQELARIEAEDTSP